MFLVRMMASDLNSCLHDPILRNKQDFRFERKQCYHWIGYYNKHPFISINTNPRLNWKIEGLSQNRHDCWAAYYVRHVGTKNFLLILPHPPGMARCHAASYYHGLVRVHSRVRRGGSIYQEGCEKESFRRSKVRLGWPSRSPSLVVQALRYPGMHQKMQRSLFEGKPVWEFAGFS